MIIEILIFVSLCLFLIYKMLLRRRIKKIRFVGCRNAGKTTLLNFLTSSSYKTVPTLEKYTVHYKDCEIEEIPERDGDFLEKYSIDDPTYDYFFFVKDFDDYRNLRNKVPIAYNLKFVLADGQGLKKQEDLICLKGDYKSFEKIL